MSQRSLANRVRRHRFRRFVEELLAQIGSHLLHISNLLTYSSFLIEYAVNLMLNFFRLLDRAFVLFNGRINIIVMVPLFGRLIGREGGVGVEDAVVAAHFALVQRVLIGLF